VAALHEKGGGPLLLATANNLSAPLSASDVAEVRGEIGLPVTAQGGCAYSPNAAEPTQPIRLWDLSFGTAPPTIVKSDSEVCSRSPGAATRFPSRVWAAYRFPSIRAELRQLVLEREAAEPAPNLPVGAGERHGSGAFCGYFSAQRECVGRKVGTWYTRPGSSTQ